MVGHIVGEFVRRINVPKKNKEAHPTNILCVLRQTHRSFFSVHSAGLCASVHRFTLLQFLSVVCSACRGRPNDRQGLSLVRSDGDDFDTFVVSPVDVKTSKPVVHEMSDEHKAILFFWSLKTK